MPPNRSPVQQPADDSDSDNEENVGEPVFNILNGEENQAAQLEEHLPEPDQEGHQFQADNHIPADGIDVHHYVRRLIMVISLVAVYIFELLCLVISLFYRTVMIIMIL